MDLASSPVLLAGRYRLIKPLAKGGMGELFLAVAAAAEPGGPEKFVALKRILPQYAANPDAVAMFLNEGRLTARIVHPNVVRVTDIGRTGDTVYYAMEYLHGVHLGRILGAAREAGRPLPLAFVVAVAQAICAGLHCAHEMQDGGRLQTIVHRDVSPGNIFVTYAGEIKLVDFGIAKALASTKVTIDGVRKGKALYMSPEQCMGEPLDRRSDIFSLGIVMYEMLTLSRPFVGDNEFAVMNRITRGIVQPPTALRPDIPPTLERILLRALATDPNARHPTALALSQELARFARTAALDLDASTLVAYLREMFGDVPHPTTGDDVPAAELSDALQRFSGPVERSDSPPIDDIHGSIHGSIDSSIDDGPTQPAASAHERITVPEAAVSGGSAALWLGLGLGLSLAAVLAYKLAAG